MSNFQPVNTSQSSALDVAKTVLDGIARAYKDAQFHHARDGEEKLKPLAELLTSLPEDQQNRTLNRIQKWRDGEIYWMPDGRKIPTKRREHRKPGEKTQYRKRDEYLQQGDAAKEFMATVQRFFSDPHQFVPKKAGLASEKEARTGGSADPPPDSTAASSQAPLGQMTFWPS